jgi:hypothetical protein
MCWFGGLQRHEGSRGNARVVEGPPGKAVPGGLAPYRDVVRIHHRRASTIPLALSLLLLAGCATIALSQRVAHLAHPDYGRLVDNAPGVKARFDADVDACDAQTRSAATTFQEASDAMFACLYARGWREPGP